MNSKTNTVRAILLDATECDRPEADHPATIEICADDLQRILERHITEPAQCLHQIAEPDAAQAEAIAEIVSASHDNAEFGERSINFLRDFQHLEYGTKLYPFHAAAPQAVQPAVPVGGQSRFKGEQDWVWCSIAHVAMVLATPLDWQNYEIRYVYAHPAEGVPAQAVASIYITENGEREFDDWKVPLSVGRNLLYTQPAAHGLDAKDCDMFWVVDDPDENHDTLHDAVVRAFEDAGMQSDGTVEIQCAKSLGNVVARITSTNPFAFELLSDADLSTNTKQGAPDGQ